MKEVLIQKGLLKALIASLKVYNLREDSPLKIDFAVLIIGLINQLPTFSRPDSEEYSYARLSSTKLRQLYYRYQDHLRFLMTNGFINKVKNYGADTGNCSAFCICQKYFDDDLVRYAITDKFLLRQLGAPKSTQNQTDKMDFVKQKRPHLVECFNDKLSMDVSAAREAIKSLLGADQKKYIANRQLILEWEQKAWHYSIKPESDNRLHSILTRTNRELRAFIKYDNSELVAIDLKTSQPFFLATIIRGLMNNDLEYLGQLGVFQVISEAQFQDLMDLELDTCNLLKFINMVLYGDFYSNLLGIIPIAYDEGCPYRMVWPKGQWGEPKTKKLYTSERDLAKEVVLEFFNGSPKSNKPEIVALRKEFPEITRLFICLNEIGVETYRLLSYVEAYSLLDVVAAKIHQEDPLLPMFSIHDSLITTTRFAAKLSKEFQKQLIDLTGLIPQLKIEYWGRLPKEEVPTKESTLEPPNVEGIYETMKLPV